MPPEQQSSQTELQTANAQTVSVQTADQVVQGAGGEAVDEQPQSELGQAGIEDEAVADEEYEGEEDVDPLAYESYSWEASEYVHHHKGGMWYFGLALLVAVLLLAAIVFKLWLSVGVFVAMGIAVAVYAHKPPRVLTYELDAKNITIEGKQYPFDGFRSFGVLSDESWHTIDLEPTKRFAPRLTVLFSDEDFDAIVAHLEAHLPRTDREPDLVERLTRYLRF